MIRFVDKQAFEDVQHLFANPHRWVTILTTDVLFAFVGGYSCGKNLEFLWDFVKQELGIDRCRVTEDALQKYFRGHGFAGSMQVMCCLLDRFLQYRPWCVACGESIRLDDPYVGRPVDPRSINGSIYHADCVRRTTGSTESWEVCAVCGEPITGVKTALRKLEKNLFWEERRAYGRVKWRYLLIDEQREFDDLNAKIPESLPLLERMRRFEEMLVHPERALFERVNVPDYLATRWRRTFEPLHAECAPRRTDAADASVVPLQGTNNSQYPLTQGAPRRGDPGLRDETPAG